MVKRTSIFIGLAIVCMMLSLDCSESFDEDRFVIINVHYSGTVDRTSQLWAVVFLSSDWTSRFLQFSSESKQIIIPLSKAYNLNSFVGYIAIVHDSNGDGILTGERSIGYENITPPATLWPVAFLEVKTIVINIDLDSANAGPFPEIL